MHSVRKDRTHGGPLSAFRNIKTARKLLAGFLAVSMLMVGVGVIGVTKLASAQTALTALYVDNFQAATWLSKVQVSSEAVPRQILELSIAKDPAARARIRAKIVNLDSVIDQNWASYIAKDVAGQEKLRDDFNIAQPAYRKVRDEQIIPLIEAGNTAGFIKKRAELVLPLVSRISADTAGLVVIDNKAAAKTVADSEAAYESARMLIIGFILISLVLSISLSVAIGRMIARPLRKTVEVLQSLAGGRLDLQLDVHSKDEVGQMAVALNAAMVRLRETMSAMGTNAQGLASSSEELSSVSSQMTGSAEESAAQANLVSAAAEQVSRNVQTVATGTEEMSASIREIAKNAHDAAGVAAQAVQVAETTSGTVAKLGQSSAEIGNVIKVINSIAEQTNLLALNATIEAARAGEAGKGFAVVAHEVKELAQETSKATEDIGRRIEAIQSDTAAAVAAITQISGIVAQINDTQSTIASAVEEQTATTNEMGRNVSEAATGSNDIAENITGVARSASDTTAAANSTSEAAGELARMSSDLQQLVGRFAY
ncbi:MAG: aerotaxis receptor [Actinomycetota bacterium]|jgi:methyl-accepting chemotaxis protein|nr:aerotaxis receptor [Actinomycetota bacterium]